MKKTKRNGAGRTNAAGRELMAALREAAHAAGTGDFSKATIRTVEIAEPGKYGPADIRALRDSLGVSQGIFALMIGVSSAMVAHWEHGIRKPAAIACRLFDKIKEDPAAYRAALIERRSA